MHKKKTEKKVEAKKAELRVGMPIRLLDLRGEVIGEAEVSRLNPDGSFSARNGEGFMHQLRLGINAEMV